MYKVLNFKACFSPLLRKRVNWEVVPVYDFPYISIIDGKKWQIGTNDFPIDEKYSLYIDGKLKIEFSSWPKKYWGEEPERRWNLLMDEVENIDKWKQGHPVDKINIEYGNHVNVVSGKHKGVSGYVTNLEGIEPEPIYYIEVAMGTGVKVKQSDIKKIGS